MPESRRRADSVSVMRLRRAAWRHHAGDAGLRFASFEDLVENRQRNIDAYASRRFCASGLNITTFQARNGQWFGDTETFCCPCLKAETLGLALFKK